ncbi:MAG TPA: YggS family pyridoxal phosphate-dependent enzyme [Gammaproteobacteria bacterium]|nr:YggS family pyridoxal phosphate-dependent enzyme [Gammaproteobacteria bacterium]
MSVTQQWHKILKMIELYEQEFFRSKGSVTVLAVSKGQPLEKIQALHSAGQHHFGENYLVEMLTKLSALSSKNIIWHYLGNLQSKKLKKIATHCHWVHSITRIKEIELLNQHIPKGTPKLNVCLQVNVQKTENKLGIGTKDLLRIAEHLLNFPKIRLRGLMTFPDPSSSFEKQREPFKRLRELYEYLKDRGFLLDTLSMGTSADFKAAIAEGSTMIRLGTILFGERYKGNLGAIE